MSAELPLKSPVLRRRNSKRSRVHLDAVVETADAHYEVELRDLSCVGALIETDDAPALSGDVVFVRNHSRVASHVAWVDGCRAGLDFIDPIGEEEVLSHVGMDSHWAALAPTETFRHASLPNEERAIIKKWEKLMREMDGNLDS